uniref:G-protein coupled receptors family 1 profile domain-containing protein n=1 Tax=Ditylenchus dipsaci TaxID=166011 RepID=A0A915DBF8_9BILA
MQRLRTVSLVHEFNAYLCFSLSFFLNILLMWLISKKSTKEMKQYSLIILQTCIIDLCLASVGALIQPVDYFILLKNSF